MVIDKKFSFLYDRKSWAEGKNVKERLILYGKKYNISPKRLAKYFPIRYTKRAVTLIA